MGIIKLSEKLNPNGLMFVMTFHSVEDRMAKKTLLSLKIGKPLFKKVIVPPKEELKENPRSRSAKLRVFKRGDS
jgi:16S rRNA (cytosine1402-N4)-methyltransferase